jgi:hypothetical protein
MSQRSVSPPHRLGNEGKSADDPIELQVLHEESRIRNEVKPANAKSTGSASTQKQSPANPPLSDGRKGSCMLAARANNNSDLQENSQVPSRSEEPVAINAVTTFMARVSLNISELKAVLDGPKSSRLRLDIREEPINSYGKSLNDVFEFAIVQLSPEELRKLKIMAFLDGYRISETFLLAGGDAGSEYK